MTGLLWLMLPLAVIAAGAAVVRLLQWSTVRLVRRTQREVARRFPADEAQRRNAALDDLIRTLKGRAR